MYSSEEESAIPPEYSRRNLKWRGREARTYKYVDDNLQVNTVNMETAQRGEDSGGNYRDKHVVECQNTFRSTIRKAESKGMKVNAAKTAMLCLSGAQSYSARSHIFSSDGAEVNSGPKIKVLGFHFSSSPTAHVHVEALGKRIRGRYWVLYHLKKAGFNEEELSKVYKTCILPVLDYCQVIYHPLLTDEQDQAIERLQSGALKCIFGHSTSYARMRELAGVTTLRQRRIEASDKFSNKCLGSARFSAWFPLRGGRSGRRAGEVYREDHARCDRLFNTPLFFMRRRLNGKEGKRYGERNKEYRNEEFKAMRTAGIKGRTNPRPPK